MIFEATNEEVLMMAKLAILASSPRGLGFLHHKSQLKIEDIELEIDGNGLYIDYYQGRMTKFSISKRENKWYCGDTTSYDYQSWKATYDDYSELLKAAKEGMNNA